MLEICQKVNRRDVKTSTSSINETEVTSRNAFDVNLFALESQKESKYEERTLFRDSPRILDQSVNPQTPNATCLWFSGLFQFQPLFGHFLPVLELETKFIKFCTKFWIKEVRFQPSRCTSLLLRSKLVQRNCLRFFKNFKKLRALTVKGVNKNISSYVDSNVNFSNSC